MTAHLIAALRAHIASLEKRADELHAAGAHEWEREIRVWIKEEKVTLKEWEQAQGKAQGKK